MKNVDRLLFGTAGIPLCTPKRETLNGIKEVKKLGLGSMEMEFVQSINVSKEKAPEVKKVAEQEGIVLTAHGQYFINLNAIEKEKITASIERVLHAARRTHECGGYSMTFHPAFYLGQDPKKVHENVLKHYKTIMKTLYDEGVDIWVRPETTGKPTQYGDLKELCKLSSELENVLPCIDVAHLHARSNGKENTLEEFRKQLELVEKTLGREALNNMHIHCAGINYSEKGEKNHLELQDSDFNYKDVVKVWKEFKIKGVVTSESPNIEKDALLLQREFKK